MSSAIANEEDADVFGYRVLGWRPVGAMPIFSPEYFREFRLSPDADEVSKNFLDKNRLSRNIATLIYEIRFIARYDGFYIADILIDRHAYMDASEKIETENQQQSFLNDIAIEAGMLVKERLGHAHYFHALDKPSKVSQDLKWWQKSLNWVGRASRNKTTGRRRWQPGAVGILAFIAFMVFAFMSKGEPQSMEIAAWFIAATLSFTFGLIWFFFVYLLFPNKRLSPNEMLSVIPVRLENDLLKTPLGDLPFQDGSWLASLKTHPPEDAKHERIALGQLRRGFLRVAERVAERMSKAKAEAAPAREVATYAFWILFFLSVSAATITGLIGFKDVALQTRLLPYLIISALVFVSVSGFCFIIMILRQDLLRVKLLRASVGFFAAANPLNEAVARVHAESVLANEYEIQKKVWRFAARSKRLSRKVFEINGFSGRSSEHSFLQDFSDLIKDFDTKLAGESQRLQIKQFWAASCAAVFGGLVTALTITVQPNVPNKVESRFMQHLSTEIVEWFEDRQVYDLGEDLPAIEAPQNLDTDPSNSSSEDIEASDDAALNSTPPP